MSHHGINLLPGIIPLDKPQKLGKKRRLRKARAGEVAYSSGVDEIDEIFVMEGEDGTFVSYSEPEEETAGGPALQWFTNATMKALLQAQEEN